jgi:uncharacterized RmlC-like cupin family protein
MESFNLGPGDFFRIPGGLVHRDVNLSRSKEVIILSFYMGTGPAVVNVVVPSAS